MNEWKELKIDKLPEDIFVEGKYEFSYSDDYMLCENQDPFNLIALNKCGFYNTYYRKPEPLPPTHEEIMTKWWNDVADDIWVRITAYDISGDSTPYWDGNGKWHDKSWFTGRESAICPPEAE